jgi:predicted transporter
MSKIMKGLLFVCAAVIVLAVPAFAGQNVVVRSVPEPTTIMMLVGGIGSIAGLRYYKLRNK